MNRPLQLRGLGLIALVSLLLFSHPAAHAQGGCITGNTCSAAPEFDPTFAAVGVQLLIGAGIWVRYARKR